MSEAEDLYKHLGVDMRPRNPFRGVHVYKTPQELIEIAFHRSKKVSPPFSSIKNPFDMRRKVTIFRFQIFCDEISKRLFNIIRKHPSVEKIHPFYQSILEVYTDINELKKHLAKIYGAAKLIEKFKNRYVKELKALKYPRSDRLLAIKAKAKLNKIKNEAYGRVTSIVKSLKKELDMLSKIVISMRKLPDLDPSLPTVVVVGPPNTGKSSLVKAYSDAKVEIAAYPFTTKNITFGHMSFSELGDLELTVQVVDTPGLFDRPLNERKKEEVIAIKALATIGTVAIFLFDASIQSTLDTNSQFRVLRDVLKVFKKKDKLIPVINKMDIADLNYLRMIITGLEKIGYKENEVVKISVIKDEGLSELKKEIHSKLVKNV